jgi:hypothetical protein
MNIDHKKIKAFILLCSKKIQVSQETHTQGERDTNTHTYPHTQRERERH